jgi:hypothetical protein
VSKIFSSLLAGRGKGSVLIGVFCVSVILLLSVGAGLAFSCSSPEVDFGGVQPEDTTQTSLGPLYAIVRTNGSDVEWQVEWSESNGGPWMPVPNGSGSILGTEIEASPKTGVITGLIPETLYFVRIKLKNNCSPVFEEVKSFETVSVVPIAGKIHISDVTGTSAHVGESVLPKARETHWRFEYATSLSVLEGGGGTPGPEGVIPSSEASEEFYSIDGELTGLTPSNPSAPTVYYVRTVVENEPEPGVKKRGVSPITSFESGGEPAADTFATHALHDGHVRALGSVLPHGYSTQYYFEYVTQGAFESGQWASAQRTPAVDAGSGEFEEGENKFPTTLVGEDFTSLEGGRTYRYRLVAVNQSGDGVGGEQVFVAPVTSAEGTEACPNEQLRTGLSARLPDCRAYEQVTPVEKGGTMDIGTYGNIVDEPMVGEDGDHVFLHAPGTQWGGNPDPKISNYVFSRTPAGWETVSVTPSSEVGGLSYTPSVFSPDLTEIGVEAGWKTTPQNASSSVELESGKPGGPYSLVASIPRADVPTHGMWAAAAADGSKLIVQSTDHELAGVFTGTSSEGEDLYEWSDGHIAQANVLSNGEKVGTCGANMVRGYEDFQQEGSPSTSSPHAVSADGSRVFFEAVPGSNCSASPHLFLRLDGSETVDIGEYRFLAANAEGTELLLEKKINAEHGELTLYNIDERSARPLLTIGDNKEIGVDQHLVVSADMTAFYFRSSERLTNEAPPLSPASEVLGGNDIYRYDIGTASLTFVAQVGGSNERGGGYSVSPDGRFFYFASKEVGGVPAGSTNVNQVYRYDSAENTIVCMSCASSSDPEPKLGAYFLFGKFLHGDGVPSLNIASSDGDIVFFDSTAELVPQDVDGEVAPDPSLTSEHVEFDRSPSSDTYEWRADDVHGCGQVQGCLSLISSGTGGFRNELLGTTPSGDDVFFLTHESLAAQDTDTAGDIYDARVDGGFPGPVVRPVECENSACSTPLPLPNDATPSSFTFTGTETPIPHTKQPSESKVRKKKPLKKCPKGKKLNHEKCVKTKTKQSRSKTRKPVPAGHKGDKK